MDAFSITFSGRWRPDATRRVEGGPVGVEPLLPESLRDYIDLRWGDTSLTAHVGAEAIVPFLSELCTALRLVSLQGPQVVPLRESGHVLNLHGSANVLHVTLLTEAGRPVVENLALPLDGARKAARRATADFLFEVLSLFPDWRLSRGIRGLRAALRRLEDCKSELALAPIGASSVGGRSRLRRTLARDFPLHVAAAALRLGPQPAGETSGGMLAVLLRLYDCLLSVVRERGRRVGVRWSSTPRTVLTMERETDGRVAWCLADQAAPWMSGVTSVSTILTALQRAASMLPDPEPESWRRLALGIRRYVRAERSPPIHGDPILMVDAQAVSSNPVPDLPVRRLWHVSYRQAWRRSLGRFHLPPQPFGGSTTIISVPEGTVGLSRATGRERWRLAEAHLLLPSGPATLLLDRSARLMSIHPETGAVRWRRPTALSGPSVVALISDAAGLVLATEAGTLHGLDVRGVRTFSARLRAGGAIGLCGSPALVWVSGDDGHLSAFRRADGALHFRVPLDGRPLGAPRWSRNRIAVTVERGPRSVLQLFDASTGAAAGEVVLEGDVPTLLVEPPGLPDMVWIQTVAGEQSVVVAVDLRRAEARYTLAGLPSRAAATPYRGALFVAGSDGRISAFDLESGAPIWEVSGDEQSEDRAHAVRPLGVRGLLLSMDSSLRVLDPATGRLVSRSTVEGLEVHSWDASSSGDLVLADNERALVALELSGHLALVDSPTRQRSGSDA